MKKHILLSFACAASLSSLAVEYQLQSPDGKLAVVVSDAGGLHYRVEVDGQPLLKSSRLGLEFAGGIALGPSARIEKAKPSHHNGTWENRFGKRRKVHGHCGALRMPSILQPNLKG